MVDDERDSDPEITARYLCMWADTDTDTEFQEGGRILKMATGIFAITGSCVGTCFRGPSLRVACTSP